MKTSHDPYSFEELLEDIELYGIFEIGIEKIDMGIRNGIPRDDIYKRHQIFSEKNSWGHKKKRLSNRKILRDKGTMKYLHSLKKQAATSGLESLAAEKRWDLACFQKRGLVDIEEIDTDYKDMKARSDYEKLLTQSVTELGGTDNIKYGIDTGLFTYEDVEERQHNYHVGCVLVSITEYGLDRMPKGEKENLEFCLEMGLISKKEVNSLNDGFFNNIIDFSRK